MYNIGKNIQRTCRQEVSKNIDGLIYNNQEATMKRLSIYIMFSLIMIGCNGEETVKEKVKLSSIILVDVVIEGVKQFPDEEIENALNKLYVLINIDLPTERIMLNWEEIKEMSSGGVFFGPHTCNHKILTGLPLSETRKELEESMQLLKEKELNFIPVFCYPNGNYNHEVQKMVKVSGYEAAVTKKYGFENVYPHNHFAIKRIGT